MLYSAHSCVTSSSAQLPYPLCTAPSALRKCLALYSNKTFTEIDGDYLL